MNYKMIKILIVNGRLLEIYMFSNCIKKILMSASYFKSIYQLTNKILSK